MDAFSFHGGGVGRLPSSQMLLQAESISLSSQRPSIWCSPGGPLYASLSTMSGVVATLARNLTNWPKTSSPAPIHIDELEMMLDEKMVLCFNTEIEDGSVEEVAEQLLIIHEDCLEGNYDSVSKLRNPCWESQQIYQSKEETDRNADGSSD